MSTESLNTAGGGTRPITTREMNGLIYTSIGANTVPPSRWPASVWGDYITHNGIKAINNTTCTKSNLFPLFSGNDITKTVGDQSAKICAGRYPIILAERLCNPVRTINTDKSTVELLYVSGCLKHLRRLSQCDDPELRRGNTATVVKYLNVSKPPADTGREARGLRRRTPTPR
jgi:hypothetical protein